MIKDMINAHPYLKINSFCVFFKDERCFSCLFSFDVLTMTSYQCTVWSVRVCVCVLKHLLQRSNPRGAPLWRNIFTLQHSGSQLRQMGENKKHMLICFQYEAFGQLHIYWPCVSLKQRSVSEWRKTMRMSPKLQAACFKTAKAKQMLR